MSITLIEKGRWFLDARVQVDGHERRSRETFSGIKRDAETRYHAMRAELKARATGRNMPGSLIVTFGDALSYYLDRNDPARSRPLFNRLLADLGAVELKDLAQRYDQWQQLMRRSVSPRTGRPYTVATMNRYLAWSNAAINLVVRYGYLESNPLRYFQKQRELPRDRLLSEDERARLLAVVKGEAPHLLPLVQYSLAVPCRKHELVSMRREWLDEVNGCIHIPAEITKTKRPVTKPIPPAMVGYFRGIPVDSDYLFYREVNGRFLPLGDFKKSWGRCLRLAGIEGYRFHDQRRGAYTQLILAGSSPAAVQKVSGHASDMSRVYLNISNMQAMAGLRFESETAVHKPDTLKLFNS